VADRLVSRLQRARDLGAEVVVDTSTDSLAEAVDRFTHGDGVAVVVEATGVPALITAALDVVASSGSVVIVGISAQDVSIPVALFSRKELNILGSRNNTGLFPESIELVRRHAERLAPLVTHTYPLDRAPEAIEFAMNHPQDVEKVVITIGTGSGSQ
jgi:L-gulonate 5-dehydrogenase